MLKDLIELNLWDYDMRNQLIADNGSVQKIKGIPDNIKELYQTVWEISQKDILQMAADRGAYIDQSQSLNLHISTATYANCTSMHFHAWNLVLFNNQKFKNFFKGLKTGIYYLRTRPAVDPVKFTVDKKALKENQIKENQDNEGCLMCSG